MSLRVLPNYKVIPYREYIDTISVQILYENASGRDLLKFDYQHDKEPLRPLEFFFPFTYTLITTIKVKLGIIRRYGNRLCRVTCKYEFFLNDFFSKRFDVKVMGKDRFPRVTINDKLPIESKIPSVKIIGSPIRNLFSIIFLNPEKIR